LICSTISVSIKAWAPAGASGFIGTDLPDGLALKGSVESLLQKYFASPVGQIISTNSRHPTPLQGRIAIVTDAGCGCGGRGSVLRATGLQGGLAKGL
jgi:hypothetical protein